MRLFGYEISLTKRLPLQPVYGTGYGSGGWQTVHLGGDGPGGWFQRDIHVTPERVQSNWAWWSCATLIANDIGKMRVKLVEMGANPQAPTVWTEVQVPAFSPVLRKPNKYQTWQQFIEYWMHSKIGPQGNTYVLKERDRRGVVVALHVLDPCRCKPLVAQNSDVYYELGHDRLARIPEEEYGQVVVPASEIIHDRTNCLFHPLVGISAIYASGLAASQGLKIQEMSATFFMNNSRPSGILTAPGILTNDQALDHAKRWNENYGAGRQGKTAILGNGLTYSPIAQTAQESQLTDQLKMTAEMICSTLHVPPYKVGVGAMPAYQNALVLNQIYYDDCLLTLIKAIEDLLDDGLGLPDVSGHVYGTDLDTDALLRMDEAALTEVLTKQVGSALVSPNEGRLRLNRGPVTGGDSPLIQQQNYSLPALAKRDAGPDPFGKAAAPPADAVPTKGIETILVGVVDAQKQLELGLTERLDGIDKRLEPDEDAAELVQLEGAKRFADFLMRQIEAEPALG